MLKAIIDKVRNKKPAYFWAGCGSNGEGHMYQVEDSYQYDSRTLAVVYRCFACYDRVVEYEELEQEIE